MNRPPVRCFVDVRKVYRAVDRNKTTHEVTAPARFKVQLVARGTGTLMYESKVCETEDQARTLCNKFLTRNALTLVLS